MYAQHPSVRPSNIGQEQPALAQQSINLSAGRPRMTPIDAMQPPAVPDSMRIKGAAANERDRGRSSMNERFSVSSPTRPRYTQSSPSHRRPHSPPQPSFGGGRFPSPGSVRHKFVREPHEGRRSMDHRHLAQGASPRSPDERNRMHESAFHHQSPPSRRFSENFSGRTYTPGSPEMFQQRSSDRPYRFLPDRSHSIGGTIDHEGLKNVPVGPSRDTRDVHSSKPRIELLAPFIFIPSMYMPKNLALRRHLFGLLKDLRPSDTIVNEDGWHLIYEDSPAGRSKLCQCYDTFHQEMLFNQYELVMQCFPDGTEAVDQRDRDARSEARLDLAEQRSPPPRRPVNVSPRHARFEGRKITYPDPFNGKGPTSIHASSRQSLLTADIDGAGDEPPQDTLSNVLKEVDTLTVAPTAANNFNQSLRSDRDDSMSVTSGITLSDTSRLRKDKCHVCNGDSGILPLKHCSACRRAYHRRCHLDPPIPPELSDDHAWRCRTCVRKGKMPKGSQQGNMFRPPSSPGVDPSGPALQPIRPVNGSESRSDDFAHVPVEAHAKASAQLEQAQLDLKKSETQANEGQSGKVTPSAVDGGKSLSDADDLVERSFAATETPAKSQLPKTGRPWKRTKIAPSGGQPKAQLPPSEASPSQSTSANTHAHPQTSPKVAPSVGQPKTQTIEQERSRYRLTSTTKHVHPQSSSNHAVDQTCFKEAVARNSALDLRALAHERHQSATKSGAEDQLAIEGRQPSLNSLMSSIPPPLPVSELKPHQFPAKPTNPAAASRLEIPESPDQVRHSNSRQPKPTVGPALPARESPGANQVHRAPQADMGANQPGRLIASKGPRGQSTATCERCERKILQGPSTRNRFCVRCKRAIAVEAERHSNMDAEPGNQNVGPPNNTTIPPTVTGPAASHKDAQQTSLDIVDDPGGNNEPPHVQVQRKSLEDSSLNEARIEEQAQYVGDPSDTADDGLSVKGANSVSKPNAGVDREERLLAALELARKVIEFRNPEFLSPDNSAHLGANAGVEQSEAEASATTAANTAASMAARTPSATHIAQIRALVGDSFERPKGSRAIIVGMALMSTPSRRMQRKDIFEWIGNNIPTYKLGEGTWKDKIGSQLCQGKVKGEKEKSQGTEYWREYDWQQGDGGQPNLRWYHLLEEVEGDMWAWDPKLKVPVEPKRGCETKTPVVGKRRREKTWKKSVPSASGTLSTNGAPSTSTLAVSGQHSAHRGGGSLSGSKHPYAAGVEPLLEDEMDVDDAQAEVRAQGRQTKKEKQRASILAARPSMPVTNGSSSDDEPLAKRRRQEPGKPLQPGVAERDIGAAATLQNSTGSEDSDDAPLAAARRHQPQIVILPVKGVRQPKHLRAPSKDARNHTNTVASLFEEWPEYRENAFNEDAKLAEIRERPSRKTMFGKSAAKSRLGPAVSIFESAIASTNVSPAKRSRMLMEDGFTGTNPYPWEDPNADPTRKDYSSLEEFFDFPDNVIPIVADGQLAFRDGTRTDDGRLPRAREVYRF